MELSYADIEGRLLGELLNGSFGSLLADNDQIKVRELGYGSRYLRARLEPVFLDDEPTGSIFVLAGLTRSRLAEHAALMNERLAATGRMAHTIAHEINNPLESITNLLFLLRSPSTGPKEAAEYISSAEDELARVSRITKQILTFHRESASPVSVDLSSLMEDVLALNNRAILEKNLDVRKEWRPDIKVEGFPAQLRQVFSNILRNAIDASEGRGKIRIRIPILFLDKLSEKRQRG